MDKLTFIFGTYVASTILTAWFHFSINRSKSDWWTYLCYSLVAVILSPIILKSIGNDVIQNFLSQEKERFEYLQIFSYVTLVGVGGYKLVQKLVSDVFGDPEKKRLDNLEAATKEVVEEKLDVKKLTHEKVESIEKFLIWISEKEMVAEEDISEAMRPPLKQAIENSLVNFDPVQKKYKISALGSIYIK